MHSMSATESGGCCATRFRRAVENCKILRAACRFLRVECAHDVSFVSVGTRITLSNKK